MADETLRSNLAGAFDPGPDFPSRLLLSRTIAILDVQVDQSNRAPVRMRLGLPRAAPLGRRAELAAGIAAVVLAAIVIGTFAYIRLGTHPPTVAPPITSASPSPLAPGPSPRLTQPLVVDPATPVILVHDWSNFGQVDGMTWDGQSGKLTQAASGAQASNPAGTLFVRVPDILDRSGRVVAKYAGGPYTNPGEGDHFFGFWADDELHYCQVVPFFAAGANPVPGTLQLRTPGGTPRDVVQVGQIGPSTNNVSVAACSVLADRAVVVQVDPNPGSNRAAQYWVVQLSTGRVLWTHALSGGETITRVVASRDGQYVAEIRSNHTTTIYGPNGSAVGQVTGSVQAFSWDGTLAVVYAGPPACPICSYGAGVSVFRWSDRTLIWTLPPGQWLSGSQAEPGGTRLAIATTDPAAPDNGISAPHEILYVVSSAGKVLSQLEMAGLYQ